MTLSLRGKKTKMSPVHTLYPLLEIRYPNFAQFENIFDVHLPIDLYIKLSTRNTLNKNLTNAALLFVALLIVIILSLAVSNSTYGISKKIVSVSDFKNIPPIVLHTEDGKQYKFDIDILQDAGHTTGEPSTAVNHLAHGDIVRLKKGEQITITYGSPFGFNDFVKGSLLKGHVTAHERLSPNVQVTGKQIVFLQDLAPEESSIAQIPTTAKIGSYNLVILITYNEEMRGYYVTNAIVN
jgi:hypothetical protein